MLLPELSAGDFDRRVELPASRWVRAGDGRVQIKAITWHEKIEQASHLVRIEGKGHPELVLQQLGDDCKPTSGRLVVDRDLYAWDVDKKNNVVPRGQLGTPDEDGS